MSIVGRYTDISSKLSIKEKDYITIIDILTKQMPQGTKVYAFGSRVSCKARQYSDLDLLVYASCDEIFKLKIAFEESSLGFNVDVIDSNSVSQAFYNEIKDSLLLVFS